MKKVIVVGVIALFVCVGIQPAFAVEPKLSADTTPPVTTISLNGTMSEWGFFSSDVEVTLTATDDLSGVNVTYYRLDIGELEIYNEPFIVTGHDKHVLVYWSVDNAGNKEKTQGVYIEIDLIPPGIDLFWTNLENKSIKFEPYLWDEGSGYYKVEYYINNEYMHTAYGEDNFEWIWTPNITGRHLASGVVYDKAGHSTRDDIEIEISRNKAVSSNMLLLRLVERFPVLQRLLDIWKGNIE